MFACVLLPVLSGVGLSGVGPGPQATEAELVQKLFAVSPLLEHRTALEHRSDDEAGGLVFLDVRGISRFHHFATGKRGAAGVFEAVRRALAPLVPRGMALAPNRFTAEVAARYQRDPVMVAPGDEALFLSRLPLSALPLPAELARRLVPLGLRTLGDFASLPVAAVERRYGQAGVALHRLARGEDRSTLLPLTEALPLSVLADIEGGADGLPRLEPVLRQAVERLCVTLREEGRGVSRLRLELSVRDREARRYELSPASAEDRAGLLTDLLVCKLSDTPPGGTVDALQLRVVQSQSMAVHQNGLFGEISRDAQRRAEALSRIKTILGRAAVTTPRLRRDHRLEERWRLLPADGVADEARAQAHAKSRAKSRVKSRSKTGPPVAGSSDAGSSDAGSLEPGGPEPESTPLRLLPSPVELVPVVAGGRTVAFRWGGRTLDVGSVSPPRRLCGGWWSEPYERDEYDLQTPDGALYRIARDKLARRWLLLAEVD